MTTNLPPRDAITFRPCTPEDVPFLRHLYASTREDELRNVFQWTDEQKSVFLDMQFDAQKKHYDEFYADADFLVIELEGEPIGRLYIFRDAVVIEIVDIAILPAYRGRGIGRVLLEEIIAEGASTKRRVEIYVEHNNPARHLYDRLGFEHIDTNGVYHRMVWKPAT